MKKWLKELVVVVATWAVKKVAEPKHPKVSGNPLPTRPERDL
jgi:hypothetical protein